MRVRLYELFVQIEREFEVLYAENLSLQEKVDSLTAASTAITPISQSQNPANSASSENFIQQTTVFSQQQHNNNVVSGSVSMPLTPAASTTMGLGLGLSSNKMSRALYAHKLRTHTNKLKQQTNKIMSNLKGSSSLHCGRVIYDALS